MTEGNEVQPEPEPPISRYNLRPRNAQGRAVHSLPTMSLPSAATMTSTSRTEKERKKKKAKKPKKEQVQLPDQDDSQLTREQSSDDEEVDEEPPKRKMKRNREPVIPASASSSATSVVNYVVRDRIPRSSFDELVGIEKIKSRIMSKIVRPFSRPSNAEAARVGIPKGLLLTGKPGTGKTCIADAIVTEVRKHRANVSYFQETGGCLSKWVGETEASLRNLFKVASERSPSVIFFDEADGLGKKRECGSSSFGTSLITTLLTEMNNVEPGRVLVILASNHDDLLDPALVRKGRVDLRIDVPLPDKPEQIRILQHYAQKKGVSSGFDPEVIKVIIEELNGVMEPAPSDLKELVEDIHLHMIDRKYPKWYSRKTTPEQLRTDLDEKKGEDISLELDVKPSIEEFIGGEKRL